MAYYHAYASPPAAYPAAVGYPHNPSYSGPPPSAPQPPMPPSGFSNPAHMGPDEFRQFYASHLATLTFNSRPIIQNLSLMAQDFQRWASIVAQCLEAHIRRVPSTLKLPAFYLLDSICKNIYEPYGSVFAPLVTDLFLDAYRSVDPSTQGKMEEMLVTWRTGAPNGRELFGVVPQVTLERSVWGGGPSASRQPTPSHPTKKQVLAELEVILAQKDRVLLYNPHDLTTAQQVDTLHQLRSVVQTTDVSPQDLNAIVHQLRSLPASAPPPPTAPQKLSYPPAIPQPLHAVAAPIPQHLPQPAAPVPIAPALPAPMPTFLPPPANLIIPATSTPVRPAVSSGPPDLMKLYSSLLAAGVIGGGSEPSTPAPKVDPELEAERRYEEQIMSLDIATSSTDMSRKRPPIASLLYKRLPSQCPQCALRFGDDESGKKRLQDHLDLHFRQNMKASQNLGRGHSRSWFVGFEDWSQEALGAESSKGKAHAANEASAEREAKLRAAFVVVPPGEEARPVQCPVCKEYLKCEFQEDDEEWVWRNAVRANDKVYHATCHADALLANPLVARLKSDASSSLTRSRSRTPESTVQSSQSSLTSMTSRLSLSPEPGSARGVKRKADDLVPVKQEDAPETPPLKRFAVAS
ncbi:hypothetical protein AURDEDRAFT_110499 [Auricularia subglabra TFB-10046 SS5]|nr:hypothetical protein AURDEDRAFT_110499 [Auricularia subglabra TFB-10046 SS5]